jgi:hypothetical protein
MRYCSAAWILITALSPACTPLVGNRARLDAGPRDTRPSDVPSEASIDARTEIDVASPDGVGGDDPVAIDVARLDAPDDLADIVVGEDVTSGDASDVREARDGSLTLHPRGITSLGGVSTVGTLRLIHLGLEQSTTQCVGTRCLTGGIVP